MRIGITLNQRIGPDAMSLLTHDVRRAADVGLESVWLPHIFGMDALTALAVVGSQVPMIQLGTGIVPTYPRHPGALAQQARTAAVAVGPGRLSLGVGVSGRFVIEPMYGYDYDRPVRHLKEYLSALVPLLDGHSVAYAGETIQANLTLDPLSAERLPVLVAALGPQMLKVAGRQTDGTVLWMTGPKTIRSYIVPTLKAAADAASRPAPRVVCILPVCVTDDAEAARALASSMFEFYGTLPNYRAMLDREGVGGPGDVAVVGTEDEVTAHIQEIAAAGATEFAGLLFTDGDCAARTCSLLGRLRLGD
ncbi:TIGR03564 family F420-dependent LLM class oxidoreductase [Nocardia brasiliensis]|uniref:TIGR03564 family F420-dependent LLM class oxidoreductase n=1 Tax=Nocardia brasiliensis TaxID=37326 RepID=UPI002458A4EA|nr:TIGR03564 family F420-dependent LLM class oxidoreductase [Nocardia brasiliensis]